VYSWVPHEVQNVILAACGKLLSPSGVAYVGYNTYPGWKAKEIVRDAMLLSAGDSATIDEKVRRACRWSTSFRRWPNPTACWPRH
jgi:hypothetical protein